MTWLLTANVSDETSGVARVEFFIDGESVGNVTTPPYDTKKSLNSSPLSGVVQVGRFSPLELALLNAKIIDTSF